MEALVGMCSKRALFAAKHAERWGVTLWKGFERNQQYSHRCARKDYSLGALVQKLPLWDEQSLSSDIRCRGLLFESRIFRKTWLPKEQKYPEAL